MQKERRRQFLIDKPLQFRYMLTVTLILLTVTLVSAASLYFGIWGNVLDAFSDEKIRNDLLTASRLEQYEEARRPSRAVEEPLTSLSFFRETERLSERQRQVFKEILDETNRELVGKILLLLALIALGTIFLSHKIAGPLFRFQRVLSEVAEKNLAVRCQLRKFDEAKSVAYAFNRALESLDKSLSDLKRMVLKNEREPERLVPHLKEELSKFKTSF